MIPDTACLGQLTMMARNRSGVQESQIKKATEIVSSERGGSIGGTSEKMKKGEVGSSDAKQ